MLHGEVQDYFNLSQLRAAVARPPLVMAREHPEAPEPARGGDKGKALQLHAQSADAWRAALPVPVRW